MTDDRQYDYELVDRFKGGDEAAFAELYERHRETVYRVAFRVLRNAEDALDVVQDAFITAHRALHRFERRAAVSTWLCQIGVHRAIDLTRKRRTRSAESTEYQAATAETQMVRGEASKREPFDPVERSEGRELERRLAEALEEISEKHRMVFVLYTMRSMSYKEIADELDISIGTVMSRLFYARKKLQARLADFVADTVDTLKERNPG